MTPTSEALRKAAEQLNENVLRLVGQVLVKHSMGVIAGVQEQIEAAVLAERETTGKVSLKYMNQQVLAEREACAKVCEDWHFETEDPRDVAAAIRARGEMTPKERAAMQQALEALEIYGEHAKDCPQYPTYMRPQDYPKCNCGFDEAITALREALAEQDIDCPCGSECVKCSPRVLLAEQAEQEPVGNISLWHNHGYQNHNVEYYGTLPDGLHQLYAAPVRTKDLTEYELDELRFQNLNYLDYARAVIAADREKNK